MHPAVLLLIPLALTAVPLMAQTTTSLQKAAGSITMEDVARHIAVIADDSMGGRDTPSRGVELTAQYVADRFKQFGLKPGGDNGSWLQRYPIPSDSSKTAPNTIGILEGTDPKLKGEYVIFSAHMDHLGIRTKSDQSDSIYNGADDNASGTAGIIELVKAFSQSGVRPRRSLIFLTVSGEEKGFWGSKHFVKNPPVPLSQVIAAVNLDMIGRNWEDTIIVTGNAESDLGAIVQKVAAARPELRMTPRMDPWTGGSDFVVFASKGVPVLDFFSHYHGDYHRVSDSPEKIGIDKEARLLRLVLYVGQEIANTDQHPQWDKARYEKIFKRPYPRE